jgi:predicted PurR-regulated permease PerM
MIIVAFGMIGVALVITDTAYDVVRQAPAYEARIDDIFAWVSRVTGQENLGWAYLDKQFGLSELLNSALAGFANSLQGVLSNSMFIALYVAFLFAAQSSFPKKMDDLFPNPDRRSQATRVAERIRLSIEKYLGVQTVISLLQTVLSYAVMVALGLDNALFWALVIFILNYIPVVGGIAAYILPPIFALVDPDFATPQRVLLLTGLLFAIQTLISNTLQPKMMGDSMNLSALVIILSITLWGSLWGGVGAFLSAPLTYIFMIILAQFKTTYWIAVLLSSDGNPENDGDTAPAAKT